MLSKIFTNSTNKIIENFCKFRTCTTKLPIETDRWCGEARQNRICQVCNMKEIGD